MANIRHFRELRVWQAAMDAAMEIFELTRHFPAEERYGLSDQARRSSRSVPSNLAEAWRRRRYPAAFVSKLTDADGEAAETQVHLEVAFRCRYIDVAIRDRLWDEYEGICKQLVTMMENPEDWTIRQAAGTGRSGQK